MIEYNVYKKNDTYKSIRTTGSFAWPALAIGLIRIPFSTVIYPAYKKEWYIALGSFLVELAALLLLIVIGGKAKPVAMILFLSVWLVQSLGFYKLQRWIAI